MKISTAILLIVACVLGAGRALAATVTGHVYQRDGAPARTLIRFTVPASQRPVVSVDDVRPGWTTLTNSATNGSFTISLYQGTYVVQVGEEAFDKFTILVPAGTNTYDISQLTTNAITPLSLVSAWIPSTNGSAYGIRFPTGATSGYVWTCTNATTGEGKWSAATGGGTNASTGSYFEADGNGDLQPITGTATDADWEEDGNGDLQPKS